MAGLIKDFLGVIKTFGIIDLIDILVVAFILYYAILLARETRAMQLVKSIGVILFIYFIATNLHISTLEFLLKNILDIGIIVLVVLFQPELRRALEKIGRSKFTDISKKGATSGEQKEVNTMIDEICSACQSIINRKEGALIVIEKDIKLGDVINTGTIIDGDLTAELISNIFFNMSPMHDGAMIIRDKRIYAAGCYLPLSENQEIAREMGTRHRAAVGISEVSDSITVVVSEERGTISVAQDGHIKSAMSAKELKKELKKRLFTANTKSEKIFWKFGEKKDESKQ